MKDFPFDPYDFFGYVATGLLVLVGIEQMIGVPEILGRDLKPLELSVVMLASYVVGQMTATPAKALLEDFVVALLLKKPSINLMRTERSALRFFFPDYFRPLPADVRDRILARARTEGLTDLQGEALFLHIRFRDYLRTDASLMSRLGTFLNKYGFNRNLCFALLVFGAATLSTTSFDATSEKTRYALLAVAGGVALFYRYLKFLRQYSYELFNSYAGRS